MDDFQKVFDVALECLRFELHFGDFSFTILQADIGVVCIAIVAYFVSRLFDMR